MDTIIYTCSISAIIGVLFGYIKHFNNLYVSNTKLIIQQNNQIKFILTRIIEIESKIKKIKLEVNDLNYIINDSINNNNNNNSDNNISVLDTIQEEILTENLDLNEEDNGHKERGLKEDDKKEKDVSFEIIETALIKTQKEKGWTRYLF